MAEEGSRSWSRLALASIGFVGLLCAAAASYGDLVLTNRSCTPEILSYYERASPRDMSEFHVSGYCSALHAIHVVNHPDTGLGGGILEGIFVVPVVLLLPGLAFALPRGRVEPLKTALYLSGAAWVLLLVLALFAASTRSIHPPGP
jgi:hypothetical protein